MTPYPQTVVRVVGEPDGDTSKVAESVIHEVWRQQRFRRDDMQTVGGERITVLEAGRLNDNQGPDFVDARIMLGSTLWAGAVEIHRTSSDWFRHGHDTDPIYHSVILHVTLVADRSTGRLTRSDGSTIPEFVLYPRLRDSIRALEWEFKKGGRLFFACSEQWMTVPDAAIAPFLLTLARDRLRRKAERLADRFLTTPDLDQIFYEETLRSLGYSQNAEAMVLLARRVPIAVLGMLRDPRDAAALLLGMSGLIPEAAENHPGSSAADLVVRFRDMQTGRLPAILPRTIWRHSRLRPANNPYRRILQASALFGPGGPLSDGPLERLAGCIEMPNPLPEIQAVFKIPSDLAGYIASDGVDRLHLGVDRCVTIAVNTILPVLLVRADQLGLAGFEDGLVRTLQSLPVVMDQIIRRYSSDRGRPASAAVTQGLHELSRSWCGQGRCRECPIWAHITGPSPHQDY